MRMRLRSSQKSVFAGSLLLPSQGASAHEAQAGSSESSAEAADGRGDETNCGAASASTAGAGGGAPPQCT